jgi:hypothetical protein
MITTVAEDFFRRKYANAIRRCAWGLASRGIVIVSGHPVSLAIFAFIVVVTAHASPSACKCVGPARLEPQAVARGGKSKTIGEVRRGVIEAAVLEQGYQASEVASFLGCHPSNVSRALQKRKSNL